MMLYQQSPMGYSPVSVCNGISGISIQVAQNQGCTAENILYWALLANVEAR